MKIDDTTTYKVSCELIVEAENKDKAISEFRRLIPSMDASVFDVDEGIPEGI